LYIQYFLYVVLRYEIIQNIQIAARNLPRAICRAHHLLHKFHFIYWGNISQLCQKCAPVLQRKSLMVNRGVEFFILKHLKARGTTDFPEGIFRQWKEVREGRMGPGYLEVVLTLVY
jgi:hypothetical protein